MTKRKQTPADNITLRDVINQMNHKFGLAEARFDKLERRIGVGFEETNKERAEILRRLEL